MKNTNNNSYVSCIRCEIGLGQVISYVTGFCNNCRGELIPSCIPEGQFKRYLERIGAYETDFKTENP